MNDGLKVQQFRTYPAARTQGDARHLVSSAVFGRAFDAAAPWIASAVSLTVFWLACFGA